MEAEHGEMEEHETPKGCSKTTSLRSRMACPQAAQHRPKAANASTANFCGAREECYAENARRRPARMMRGSITRVGIFLVRKPKSVPETYTT